MKYIPILFSGPMVIANLEGRKTQTRRLVKGTALEWLTAFTPEFVADPLNDLSPYGFAGDVLWVRETFMHSDDLEEPYWFRATFEQEYNDETVQRFKGQWKPSIFMPKEACRIFLHVANVRIERLQDISEVDAIAEGIEREGDGWKSYEVIHDGKHKGTSHPHAAVANADPRTSYRELWEAINGKGSWALNPWVWVVEYEKIE